MPRLHKKVHQFNILADERDVSAAVGAFCAVRELGQQRVHGAQLRGAERARAGRVGARRFEEPGPERGARGADVRLVALQNEPEQYFFGAIEPRRKRFKIERDLQTYLFKP